jgi:transmembrane sensor
MSHSTTAPAPYTDDQRHEAADWFVIIRDENEPNAETLQAWLRWMEATEGNRLAFEAVAQAWHAAPASLATLMPSARELLADDYDGAPPLPITAEPNTARTASRRRFPWPYLAAASVATIALLALAVSQYRSSGPIAASSNEFVTTTGEQMEITLADGSRVSLGAKSRLRVAFTAEHRGVRLETGEAFFSVRKDRTRPFVVHATSGNITAVGTSFDVRAVAQRLTVAVIEGVVSVSAESQPSAPKPTAVRVASGQQVTIDPGQQMRALAVTDSSSPGERARWREGLLVYRDEPLRVVVADVARYSKQELVLDDDSVGELHFSGVVYKDAVDEWAAALPESFPVALVSEGGRLLIKAR